MLPSQFKRLLELLHEQSSVTKQGFKEQEHAIREAQQSANEKRGDIPRVIARAINDTADEVANYEKTQRDKEYRQQKVVLIATCVTALATLAAFAAAFWYASIAKDQLDQMKTATVAAKSAAETAAGELGLAKNRIEAQEQAIVTLAFPDLDIRSGTAGIALANSGQRPANDVHAAFRVTEESLPDRKAIWESQVHTLDIKRMPNGSPYPSDVLIPGISLDNWAIDPAPPFFWKETVIVDGSFSYDNGFGTQVRQEFCQSYLRYNLRSGTNQRGRNGWVSCEELNDSAGTIYSDWRKQTQQQRKP